MNLKENINRIKQVMGLIVEDTDEFSKIIDSFSDFMKIGVDSDEVSTLQNVLKMEDIDGDFGEKTEECVKEFQDFVKLKSDGIVGPNTRRELNKLLKGELSGWKGCGKTIEKKDSSIESSKPSDVVGSSWRSCKAWFGKGGLNKWGDRVKISKSSSEFKITYEGPTSGVAMAHASGGGDTIHQVYNILICEINPFLSKGNMKPDLEGISIQGGKSSKGGTITIRVPLESTEGTYQLDRRGGWNHDPSPSKMANKCKRMEKRGKECFGPVTKIVSAPFGKITEHFITHEI